MKSSAVVSEKGQVTIPQALRRSLGIVSGMRLIFEEQAGRLVATPSLPTNAMEALVGIGVRGRTDEFLERTRGPRFDKRRDRRQR